ncbi:MULTISPECIES: cytidylate kinase-like family protein [Prevotella]|uniref:Cytidylate kinase n=1 Tax=Prevotella herbatica TaxID=2801997 RepID=A0ABN6EES5_9BACT|nr:MULTISPECIES: cytidylate kinase-like family protein [Prevotella]MDN5553270.1 cytidylate kinase-like family protein [Prevotella sp.]BCS84392.1 cytidylate kinase [Prevotella herbatica]
MEDKKIIINIGRQIGSGGRYIAKKLSEELNYSFYDRELLNLAAHESGFSETFFEQADEHKGFFKSLLNIHIPLIGESNFYKNDLSQESLYKFQSDAILKAAEKGNCIFVGRTADYVLRDFKNTINIFVTADIDQRIQRVSKRYDMNSAEARKYITDKEEARASYYNYYTGKQWGHSESYDLCINSSLLGIEDTEAFIAELIKKRFQL